MLAFDPKERITIADIKKHPWYNDKYLQGKDLIRALRSRHREMESKRRKDARKVKDLQTSIGPDPTKKAIDFGNVTEPPLFPEDQIESVLDTYTTVPWKDVYSHIEHVIGSDGGLCTWEPEDVKLTCTMKLANDPTLAQGSVVKFEINCYRSRDYANINENTTDYYNNNNNNNNNTDEKEEEIVYVIRMRRLEGTAINFSRIKRVLFFERCGSVLTGLPQSVLRKIKLQRIKDKEQGIVNDPFADLVDEEEEDDYDNILANDAAGNAIAVQ
jgi:hypothetical protein